VGIDWDLILDVYGKAIMTVTLILNIIKMITDKKKTAPKKPRKQKRKR